MPASPKEAVLLKQPLAFLPRDLVSPTEGPLLPAAFRLQTHPSSPSCVCREWDCGSGATWVKGAGVRCVCGSLPPARVGWPCATREESRNEAVHVLCGG